MANTKYKLRYLPLFYRDLEEKVVYIAEELHNEKAANDLLDEVEKAILECVYCYATKGKGKVEAALSIKDNSSPILCDRISERDHMIERKVQSSVSKRYIKK